MEVLEALNKSIELKVKSPVAALTDDVLFIPKKASHRDDSDNVFFDGAINVQLGPQLPVVSHKIKVKDPEILASELKELKLEQKLHSILRFFDKFEFVNLANFKVIQNLLVDYFSHSYSLQDSIRKLKEEVDKHSKDTHRFGKLFVNTVVKNNSLRLTLTRSKAKDTKQYVSFTLDEQQHSELFVYTSCVKDEKRRSQLIRNCMLKNRSFKQDKESIKFDAATWKSFNIAGLHRKDYLKTLDCIERNRLNLSELINEINRKNFSNVFDRDLIRNIKIKTDNKHVLSVDFHTNQGQLVTSMLTRDAASITVIE